MPAKTEPEGKAFTVNCTETVTYEMSVRARDADDAIDVARLLLLGDESRAGALLATWPDGCEPLLEVEARSWSVEEATDDTARAVGREQVETFLDERSET